MVEIYARSNADLRKAEQHARRKQEERAGHAYIAGGGQQRSAQQLRQHRYEQAEQHLGKDDRSRSYRHGLYRIEHPAVAADIGGTEHV